MIETGIAIEQSQFPKNLREKIVRGFNDPFFMPFNKDLTSIMLVANADMLSSNSCTYELVRLIEGFADETKITNGVLFVPNSPKGDLASE